ncbi:MAG: DNA polymerase III subunit delta' [Bacillaceae bacterium]
MIKSWEQLSEIQPVVSKMLLNSVMKQRVAHAYLFEGTKGTRKLATAMFFAKMLLCQHKQGYNPCQRCSNCKRVDSHNHPDLYIVQPDGLSIKKEQIQLLQSEFSKTAVESDKKIYIIEHADKMTANAANSLLKFLEEPVSEAYAILITENSNRLLNTILSRCQIISFRTVPSNIFYEDLLKENVPTHLASIIAQLTSNLEEALTDYHNEWFAQARDLVIKLYEAYNQDSSREVYLTTEKWTKHFDEKEKVQLGFDMLLLFVKDILYAQVGESNKCCYKDQVPMIESLSLKYSQQRVLKMLANILEAKKRVASNVNIALIIEQLMIQLQEG